MTRLTHRSSQTGSSPSQIAAGTSATPPPDSAPHGPRLRIRWAAIAAFVLLAGLAIYATLTQGISRINVSDGTIEFVNGAASSQRIDSDEITQEQSQLVSTAAEAKQRASQAAMPAPSSIPNIAGRWSTGVGLAYDVFQYGDQIVVQEVSAYGVTAVGQGVIQGQTATFSFVAVNGVTGQGQFDVIDERTIDAAFMNSVGGSNGVRLAR